MKKTAEKLFAAGKGLGTNLQSHLPVLQGNGWGSLTGVRPTKIVMGLLEKGESDDKILAYMADRYGASQEKIKLCLAVAKREREVLKALDLEDGYSLYLSIPFCPSRCLYCSFPSYGVEGRMEQVGAYLKALEKEVLLVSELCAEKKLNTIYIGGGTPTTLSPAQLDWLLALLAASFDFSHLLEYTVEAGRPDSIIAKKLAVIKRHVGQASTASPRISINPQTMQQKTLDLIGRRHTVEQAKESFSLARSLGFDNVNMDLILALPGETIIEIKDTLDQAMALAPDSLTIHSLAIKRGSELNERNKEFSRADLSAGLMGLTARYAEAMGLFPYYLYRNKDSSIRTSQRSGSTYGMVGNLENVGYARPGKEGLYNILIMEEKQTIMALGAGAITKFVSTNTGKITRVDNVKDIDHYLNRIDEMLARKKEGLPLWH